MNQEARDVLVGGQLQKVRQARGAYARPGKYFCAVGLLLQELIKTNRLNARWEPKIAWDHTSWCALVRNEDDIAITGEYALKRYYDIDGPEIRDIEVANDDKKWSFLEIARKIGVKEEQP